MKSMITASVMFAAVIIFVIINAIMLGGLFKDLMFMLDSLPQTTEEANALTEVQKADVSERLDKIHDKWKSHEIYIYFALEHESACEFFNTFLPAREYFKCGNYGDYTANLSTSKDTLEHMKFDEGVNIGNIF